MDCIIVAGGAPAPDDPMYTYTQGRPRALLDMNGRTALERVVDALQDAREIEDVIVVGLGDDRGMSFHRPVHHLPDHGGMISNGIAGIKWLRRQKPDTGLVLITSADIPTITGPIVDYFIHVCRPLDQALYYNFVTQETMETRFPHSNRTFVKLAGARVAGGDMIIFHTDLAESHQELWEALSQARKHAWRLAGIVGFSFLLRFLTRRVTFAELETTASRIIEHPVKVIINPHAEIAMDADKPHQVDLLRADLLRHSRAAPLR